MYNSTTSNGIAIENRPLMVEALTKARASKQMLRKRQFPEALLQSLQEDSLLFFPDKKKESIFFGQNASWDWVLLSSGMGAGIQQEADHLSEQIKTWRALASGTELAVPSNLYLLINNDLRSEQQAQKIVVQLLEKINAQNRTNSYGIDAVDKMVSDQDDDRLTLNFQLSESGSLDFEEGVLLETEDAGFEEDESLFDNYPLIRFSESEIGLLLDNGAIIEDYLPYPFVGELEGELIDGQWQVIVEEAVLPDDLLEVLLENDYLGEIRLLVPDAAIMNEEASQEEIDLIAKWQEHYFDVDQMETTIEDFETASNRLKIKAGFDENNQDKLDWAKSAIQLEAMNAQLDATRIQLKAAQEQLDLLDAVYNNEHPIWEAVYALLSEGIDFTPVE